MGTIINITISITITISCCILMAKTAIAPVDGRSWPGVSRHQHMTHIVWQIQNRLGATLTGFLLSFSIVLIVFYFLSLPLPPYLNTLTNIHPKQWHRREFMVGTIWKFEFELHFCWVRIIRKLGIGRSDYSFKQPRDSSSLFSQMPLSSLLLESSQHWDFVLQTFSGGEVQFWIVYNLDRTKNIIF